MDSLDGIARAQLAALLASRGPNNPVTPLEVAEAIRGYAQEELLRNPPSREQIEREGISADSGQLNEAIEKGIELIVELVDGNPRQRIKFSDEDIAKYCGGKDPWFAPREEPAAPPPPQHLGFDIIRAISGYPIIAAHLGQFLQPRCLINLYSISRDFHNVINNHLLSSILAWLRHNAPDAVTDFPFKLYRQATLRDPAGRTFAYEMHNPVPSQGDNDTRIVPSLRWYHMVVSRERYCQQIYSFLARAGHLLPITMHQTLKRMWLIMDVASNKGRVGFMANRKLWTLICTMPRCL
jgi:hypothetical protein